MKPLAIIAFLLILISLWAGCTTPGGGASRETAVPIAGTWVFGSMADRMSLIAIYENGTFQPFSRAAWSGARGGPGDIYGKTGTWSQSGKYEYRFVFTEGQNITLLYDQSADLLIVKEVPTERLIREGRTSIGTVAAGTTETADSIYQTDEFKAHVHQAIARNTQLVSDLRNSWHSTMLNESATALELFVHQEIADTSRYVLPLEWEIFRQQYLSALSTYGAAASSVHNAGSFQVYSTRWQDWMQDAGQFLSEGDENMGHAIAMMPGVPVATPETTTAVTAQPGGTRTGDLEVISHTMSLDQKGYGSVTGQILNHGPRRYKDVKVIVRLYDKADKNIGFNYDSVKEIAPYGTWNFDVSVFIPNVDHYRVSEIEAPSYTT